MAIFKGVSTLQDYEECIKRGLCEEHIKEIGQNEFAVLKDEFPRKAFHYIRINILYPLLFKKSPKLEKIKKLMEKTPALSKILLGGDISESLNTIFILDSVIIFTLCQLSQICCIGALFHIKKKNSDDSKLKPLRQLLLVDQLDKTIVHYLYPILQKNFVGCDTDIIKASHIITLIFVRNFCTKFNMKTAIENIEKDIKGDEDWKHFKTIADGYYKKGKFEDALKSYISALFQNSYSPDLYNRLADCYMNVFDFKASQLYAYLALSLKPNSSESYWYFSESLKQQEQYQEAAQIIHYALEVCKKSENYYALLKRSCKEVENHLNKKEIENKIKNLLISGLVENKEPSEKSMTVKLIDSDSAESENECEVTKKVTEQTDADFSDESETMEKKSVVYIYEKTKNKLSGANKKKRTTSESMPEVPAEEEMDVDKINAFLKEASEALLVDCGYKAVQIFRGPLRNFIESPKLLSFEECDIVCIKYSYGIAYCKSGGHDDLVKCINILKDIIENHDGITFPAAYYSLGLAYRKLNRFKESLNYLEIVQNFLCKGIHFKVYPWPGMTTVIQETKPDVLKTLVKDLIRECENPPNPDAYCRYVNCEYQRSIYYTDPDFKGYVTLSCSEQCCMQYHFMCWKAMKTEKEQTDKDFLENSCYTPDCEGVIVKIQNIDKKGDLSKEFTSDFKKHTKPKGAKWEKKSESKEKKRKKGNSKSEECFNGSERRNSNADEESVPLQLSSSGGSFEETSKSENNEKSSSVTPEREIVEHQNSITDSSSENPAPSSNASSFEHNKDVIMLISDTVQENEAAAQLDDKVQENEAAAELDDKVQENEAAAQLDECIKQNVYSSSENPAPSSNASSFEDNKELSDIKVQENEAAAHLDECIKQNVYSFINDFLQHHGPLKVDDPLLTDEIESFPEEVHIIIAQFGGIGEFLKDDLRFAYVGDTYVCVVDDLATAYKMYSTSCLPKDFKNFQSLEGTDDKISYNKCNSESQSQNIGLNPDAMEYTPSNVNKKSHYKFSSGNSTSPNLNSDSPAFVPAALKRSPEYQTSSTGLDTFFDSLEVYVNKLKNSESVLNENFPNASEPITSTSRHSKTSEYCDNSGNSKSPACTYKPTSSESLNSDSKISNGENVVSPVLRKSLITTKTERSQLLNLLKMYDSEDMKPCRQELDSFIKPFVIKKSPEVASTGSMTDTELARENISKDADVLSEQNLLLRKKLESATQKEQQLMAEVAKLQKHSKELEVLKKEYENKEQGMLNSRKYLLESLTNAHETIDNQKQKLTLLTDERYSLQKTIGQLNVSLKMSEERLKSTLDAKEKHFNSIISSLKDEKEELKDRAKYAELQVLHLKKTEYLKKIDEKSAEATKRKKELTDGLSMVSCNLNPVLQGDMKALTTQLSTYANDLGTIKLDFMRKIDEKIEMVNKGTPLKEIKELEMKDLPEIPCWKSSVPVNGRTLDKQALNPIQLPVNFGLNMPASRQVSTDLNSPFTTDTPMIPGTKVPPTKAVPAAAAIAPPSAAVATPVLSSTLKSNASSKAELSNGIDFGTDSNMEESFKNAMASINSFASTPYVGPTLDDEFRKNCVVFKHTDPVPANKPEIPNVPPGIQNATGPSTATRKVLLPDPIPTAAPRRTLLLDPPIYPIGEKRLDSLDTVPISEAAQSTWDLEKKKAASGKNSYEKLLSRLKEHFPQYSQEELVSFVKEFRAQRQGKLSGLPMDTIISQISNLIMEKKMSDKKVSELKALPKSTKVLVNKKLVSDPKPPTSEQQSVKRKAAWGLVDSEARRNFSGSLEDDCVICCDPMTSSSAYKVSCGHTFHEDCIRQWLQTQSNCPVCRNLLLLPDEYPSLS